MNVTKYVGPFDNNFSFRQHRCEPQLWVAIQQSCENSFVYRSLCLECARSNLSCLDDLDISISSTTYFCAIRSMTRSACASLSCQVSSAWFFSFAAITVFLPSFSNLVGYIPCWCFSLPCTMLSFMSIEFSLVNKTLWSGPQKFETDDRLCVNSVAGRMRFKFLVQFPLLFLISNSPTYHASLLLLLQRLQMDLAVRKSPYPCLHLAIIHAVYSHPGVNVYRFPSFAILIGLIKCWNHFLFGPVMGAFSFNFVHRSRLWDDGVCCSTQTPSFFYPSRTLFSLFLST